MTASRLVIGIGNPGRGDDALGPLCIERLAALALPDVDLLTDFQLQVEFLLDLHGRDEVVVVDAAATGPAPFAFAPVAAAPAVGISTHALAPGAVLAAYRRHYGTPPPPCHVLAIRGYGFELGADLTAPATAHLEAAVAFVAERLDRGDVPAPGKGQGRP